MHTPGQLVYVGQGSSVMALGDGKYLVGDKVLEFPGLVPDFDGVLGVVGPQCLSGYALAHQVVAFRKVYKVWPVFPTLNTAEVYGYAAALLLSENDVVAMWAAANHGNSQSGWWWQLSDLTNMFMVAHQTTNEPEVERVRPEHLTRLRAHWEQYKVTMGL